jgi:7,8-dihydropterin-6-yl-methyl-4-(beta-D-ribofuranosyl)aminobenzene 5'-phosphate synthase
MTQTFAAASCEGARITVLDENFIDILLPSTPALRRYNMDQHFDPKCGELQAENGFCLLIETVVQSTLSTVLFDAGLTADVVLHNADVLGVDLRRVDAVVLSGLARNFGDVFELWSGGQCGVGVVVSGDALE